MTTHPLWEQLETLKKLQWIDLSHPLTNDSPYWQGMPQGVVEIGKTLMDFDEINLHIQTFKFPGQFGTHIDYPAHFHRGARTADKFPIKSMVLPLVVIDRSTQVAHNPDYVLSVDDILRFEAEHGAIPSSSFVAFRSDWSKRWADLDALQNTDTAGVNHTPGWSLDALKYLCHVRFVAAIGHETLDTDSGVACHQAGDLVCERYLLSQDRYQVELLNNLDKLPAMGAIIFIAGARIINANGLPVRAWAVLP